MSETLNTAAPSADTGASATAVPTTDPHGYGAAAASLTEETWTPPAEGMAVTDGETVDAPEVPTSAVAGEFVEDEQGRWHRADGTFANETELAAINAELAAAPAAAPAEVEKSASENVVSIRRRDGSTREVVIDDPELAQEINQNFNDGMRRREFLEKSAALDARLAQFNKMDALLEKNPEAVVRESLSPDQRIRLGVMLLAEHFDELVPAINEYNSNPSARIAATAEAQLRMKQQSDEFTSYTAAQNAAAEVRQAVAKLIPEDAAQEIAENFWADASTDCQRAMSRGEKVDPTTVPAILANRLKLYGFAASAAPAADTKARITARSAAASAIAQPANDAAKQLADAKTAQRRIQLTQRNRKNAAAVPPQGAGAAPMRIPPAPKGQSIDEASQGLRQLGNRW